MAFSTLNLKHPEFEITKEVPVGFSWTILFFGFFPPLFRGDFKWGLIMLIAALLTSFLASLIFMFIYNKIYLKSLLEKGYTSIDSEEVLSPIEAKLTMKIPRKS
jgi:hypothetical protein|tara:strand:+ start:162 stop:473 length:312 start_codon:yes stop_codon:yes gene_type:complete